MYRKKINAKQKRTTVSHHQRAHSFISYNFLKNQKNLKLFFISILFFVSIVQKRNKPQKMHLIKILKCLTRMNLFESFAAAVQINVESGKIFFVDCNKCKKEKILLKLSNNSFALCKFLQIFIHLHEFLFSAY